MSLEIQAFYFPFLAPKIYRETSTVKFSFKHKEKAFLVSWYLVCQPLDVSAAPLKKSSSPLPSLWMGRKREWRLLFFVAQILERHLHFLEKLPQRSKYFLIARIENNDHVSNLQFSMQDEIQDRV